MFNAEQLNPQVFPTGKAIQGAEGKVMLNVGLKAEHEFRPVRDHTKHIIAVVATDVTNNLIGKAWKFRQDSVPLEFTAPFGINIDVKETKRALAPGHEPSQSFLYSAMICQADLFFFSDGYHVAVKIAVRGSYMLNRFKEVPVAQKTLFGLPGPGLFFEQNILQVADPGAGKY